MAFVSLLVSVFIFLLGALAQLFGWDLQEFSALFWGLFFFSLSFLIPGAKAYAARIQ